MFAGGHIATWDANYDLKCFSDIEVGKLLVMAHSALDMWDCVISDIKHVMSGGDHDAIVPCLKKALPVVESAWKRKCCMIVTQVLLLLSLEVTEQIPSPDLRVTAASKSVSQNRRSTGSSGDMMSQLSQQQQRSTRSSGSAMSQRFGLRSPKRRSTDSSGGAMSKRSPRSGDGVLVRIKIKRRKRKRHLPKCVNYVCVGFLYVSGFRCVGTVQRLQQSPGQRNDAGVDRYCNDNFFK